MMALTRAVPNKLALPTSEHIEEQCYVVAGSYTARVRVCFYSRDESNGRKLTQRLFALVSQRYSSETFAIHRRQIPC